MVQHNSFESLFSEINEFQVVHALITQSQKGVEEADHEPSYKSADNSINAANSQNNIITAMCQHFKSFNSSSPKRIFPKFVKEFINQVRKSQEWCSAVSCSSRSTPSHEKQMISPKPRSCVVRYASVLHSSNKSEKKPVPKTLVLKSANVQDKVLQFEKQAEQLRHPVLTAPPSSPIATERLSPAEDRPVLPLSSPELLHNRENPDPPTISPPIPPPPPPPLSSKAPANKGRSLKRVPSERFQKIRRKVQRLMSKRSESSEPDSPCAPDSIAFLQSIRIPDPRQVGSSAGVVPCPALRMPDHVLRHIFSMLDTKTLAAVKCACADFNFIINHFDIRATDSRWTADHRYLSDPCTQCRHTFSPGDMSMCRFHPKRYYSDLPYGRSYWMCCLKIDRGAPGCKTGLHDNHWHKLS